MQTSLVTILTELFFGDEEQESLETALDRLISPGFQQRINGDVYNREDYPAHVREMQASVAGGRVDVVEEMRDGRRIAGRYLFNVLQAAGEPAVFESHIFAELASDGRLLRMAEDSDGSDLLLPS